MKDVEKKKGTRNSLNFLINYLVSMSYGQCITYNPITKNDQCHLDSSSSGLLNLPSQFEFVFNIYISYQLPHFSFTAQMLILE